MSVFLVLLSVQMGVFPSTVSVDVCPLPRFSLISLGIPEERIPGHVLRACADQLASVFIDIFNLSLLQSIIPTCFKVTTIVPVPDNSKGNFLNEYRPIALTSVIMKCFERLVMTYINTIIPDTLHPLQFAYRSTDDAISIALHTAHSHLDKRGNYYVRMLLIDCSSAFNTIVPDKLRTMGLNTSLWYWIPGGEGRQQHLRHADPQDGGPSWVNA